MHYNSVHEPIKYGGVLYIRNSVVLHCTGLLDGSEKPKKRKREKREPKLVEWALYYSRRVDSFILKPGVICCCCCCFVTTTMHNVVWGKDNGNYLKRMN